MAQAQPYWEKGTIALFYKEETKVHGHPVGEGKEGPHPNISTRSGIHPLFLLLPAIPRTSTVWKIPYTGAEPDSDLETPQAALRGPVWPGQQRTINYWDHTEAGLGPSAGCLHRTRLFGASKSMSDVNGTASFFCRGGIPWGCLEEAAAGLRLGGGRLKSEDTICQAANSAARSPHADFPPSTVGNTAQHL